MDSLKVTSSTLVCLLLIGYLPLALGLNLTLGFDNLSPPTVVGHRNEPLLLNCSPSFLPPSPSPSPSPPSSHESPQSLSTSTSTSTSSLPASSSASLTISWRHEGVDIPPKDPRRQVLEDGSLLIKRLIAPKKRRYGSPSSSSSSLSFSSSSSPSSSSKKSDEGFYICVVRYSVGVLVSYPIKVVIARTSQSFRSEPQPVSVREGANARFRCQINSVPQPVYKWLFNNQTLPQTSSRHFELPTGILQIVNVSQTDEGNYSCVANTEARTAESKAAQLTVINAPAETDLLNEEPEFLNPSAHSVQKTKETVIFECLINNTLYTTITWSRESGKPLQQKSRFLGESNLVIEEVTREDDDVYVCNATTTNDISITQRNILTVQVPPTILKRPQNTERPTAQTARLDCSVDGVPTPSIKWLKNGEPVFMNGRIKMKSDSYVLVVSQTVLSDSGIYQCVAENEAGFAVASARLLINASHNQPDPPDGLFAVTVSSTEVQLSWKSGFSPNGLQINAYTVHYMPVSGGFELQKVGVNSSVTIDKLRPFTNYSFYVRAYNGRSASEQSERVTQMTGEDVPIGVPLTTLTPLSATNLQVSWNELPPQIARGKIVSYRIHYRKHNQASHHVVEHKGSDSKTHTIEGLQPGGKYDVRVSGATSVGYPRFGGESDWPWIMQEMPDEDSDSPDATPLAPVLQLVAVNATCIEVSWSMKPQFDSTSASVEGFRLSYRRRSRPFGEAVSLPLDVNQYFLTNLEPHSWYEVHLVSFNAKGDGRQAVQGIMTLPAESGSNATFAPPNVPPPEELEARPLSPTTIQVVWRKGRSNSAAYYTIRYHPVLVEEKGEKPVYSYIRSTKSQVLVTDLQPFTSYEFSVSSHGSNNEQGQFSPKIECKTLEDIPTEPLQLEGVIIGLQAVMVSWQPPEKPNGIVSMYQIFHTNVEPYRDLNKWDFHEERGSQLTTTIANLSSNTQYYICTRALTKAGAGPASSIFTISIPPVRQQKSRKPEMDHKTSPASDFSDNLLGIVLGLSSGLILVVICIFIVFCRNRLFGSRPSRQCYSNGNIRPHGRPLNGHLPSMYGEAVFSNERSSGANGEAKELESFTSSFFGTSDNHLDTKGGYSSVKLNGHCKGQPRNGLLKPTDKRYSESDQTQTSSSLLLTRRSGQTQETQENGRHNERHQQSLPLSSHSERNSGSQGLDQGTENCAPGRPPPPPQPPPPLPQEQPKAVLQP